MILLIVGGKEMKSRIAKLSPRFFSTSLCEKSFLDDFNSTVVEALETKKRNVKRHDLGLCFPFGNKLSKKRRLQTRRISNLCRPFQKLQTKIIKHQKLYK
nr:hypothetical protein [Tanacetum cinerariifolium]